MKLLIKNIEPEFEEYFRVPDDFNPKDKERIEIFSKRMCEIRSKRNTEMIPPRTSIENYINKTIVGDRKAWTQEELAKVLGVHKQMVYKYEKGAIEKVPLKYLRKICYFYDVTPHYLLGYTKNENTTIGFYKDKETNKYHLDVDEKGNPQELKVAMWFTPTNIIEAANRYKELSLDNGRLFELINKLISSSKEKQDICSLVLDALLNK